LSQRIHRLRWKKKDLKNLLYRDARNALEKWTLGGKKKEKQLSNRQREGGKLDLEKKIADLKGKF